MPRPSRNEIYESVIRKMVLQALEEQEQAFSGDHACDTDGQLFTYLREQAEILGHTPRYKEIIGWKLITERFGTWETALKKAGLPIPSGCPAEKLPRIRLEAERQKELYRQKKAEKKRLSEQRRIRQEANRKK